MIYSDFDSSDFRSSYDEDMALVYESLKHVSKERIWTKISELSMYRINKIMSSFDSLNDYSMVVLAHAWETATLNRKSILLAISVNSVLKSRGKYPIQREITEMEFAGIATLRKDYGHVFIRPETLADKITELVCPVEIDFDSDKEFSRKYYCVVSDELKFRTQVTQDFFDAIKKHDGVEIEIVGNNLLVRTRKRVSVETANLIVDIVCSLNNGYC